VGSIVSGSIAFGIAIDSVWKKFHSVDMISHVGHKTRELLTLHGNGEKRGIHLHKCTVRDLYIDDQTQKWAAQDQYCAIEVGDSIRTS
jgi:hypothetical protein